MIHFFRRIRQGLLSQNRFSKYMLYAIGEIALVMIGILLALQVNTWNENRKDNLQEQQILIQLKEEYTVNMLQLEQKIAHREKIIAAANKVLQYIDDPSNVTNASLINKLNKYIGTPTIEPIENNLISSGNINLIKNKKLK